MCVSNSFFHLDLLTQAFSIGLRAGSSVFDSQEGMGIFLFTTASRPALGSTQPRIQNLPGNLSLGLKWLGREADHSPASSAEYKNECSYTATPVRLPGRVFS